jgi:hypothetical protein
VAAALLHGISGGPNNSWQSAPFVFTFPNDGPALNSPTAVQLDCSDNSVDLKTASILWDVEGETQPAFGRTFTIRPRTSIGETLVEAEAVLPDGRRVFGHQYLEVNDPVNGGTAYPWPDPQSETVALYHFDGGNPANLFRDDTGNGYDLQKQGYTILQGNNSWMKSVSGSSARFGGLGDRLEPVNTIPDGVLRPNGGINGFTIEFWIYLKRFPNNGSALYLLRFAQGAIGNDNSEWSVYYNTTLAPFPQFFGPKGQLVFDSAHWSAQMTTNTWHLVKITVAANGNTTVQVDRNTPVTQATSPTYDGENWILSLGDFVGCYDEIRVSKAVR